MKFLRYLIRRFFWRHHWTKGRNPYRRTCSVCGRHEVSYCASIETWHQAWWVVHDDGEPSKHWRKA